jgi:hypothetical protein
VDLFGESEEAVLISAQSELDRDEVPQSEHPHDAATFSLDAGGSIVC